MRRWLVTLASLSFAVVACSLNFDVGETPRAGTIDASVDAPGPPASPCASSGHILCDDFDDGIDPRWTKNEAAGGALAIAPREGGGQMLVATLPDGTARDANLWFEPNTEQALRVSFDVRFSDPKWTPDNAINFAMARLLFELNGKWQSANLYLEPNESAARVHLTYEAQGVLGDGAKSTFAFGVWHHVAFEVDFGSTARTVYSISGETPNLPASTFTSPEGKPSLSLGLFRPNGATPPLHVEFDNLVVDPL